MKENYSRYHLIRILPVLIILILLNSCNIKEIKTKSNKEDAISLQDTKKQVVIDLKKAENILPAIESEFEILFFEEDIIILSTEKHNIKQVDSTDMLLYKYDLDKKETKFIAKIQKFYSSFVSMELVEEKLYFPYSKMEGTTIENFIMTIDINTLETEEISYGNDQENAIRLESVSNSILKHYQVDKGSGETDYYIDVIENGKKRNIIKSKYSSGNGELLVDIFGDKDNIYIYTLDIINNKKTYVIEQYDLNGKLEDSIELEMDSFLYLPEVNDKDIVYNIYKVNNYFILNTLNGRNRIIKKEGNKFIAIGIPKILEDFNEGANVIQDGGKKDSLIFFECLMNRGEIIIFDTINEQFTEVLINSENIVNIIRDSIGNLIVFTKEENRENKFYYIKRGFYYNLIK